MELEVKCDLVIGQMMILLLWPQRDDFTTQQSSWVQYTTAMFPIQLNWISITFRWITSKSAYTEFGGGCMGQTNMRTSIQETAVGVLCDLF